MPGGLDDGSPSCAANGVDPGKPRRSRRSIHHPAVQNRVGRPPALLGNTHRTGPRLRGHTERTRRGRANHRISPRPQRRTGIQADRRRPTVHPEWIFPRARGPTPHTGPPLIGARGPARRGGMALRTRRYRGLHRPHRHGPLSRGDALHFPARLPHSIRNTGGEPAEMLLVCTHTPTASLQAPGTGETNGIASYSG